ncbi:MAG: Inner membrane protein YohD [Holosporales bacterium]
MESIFEFVKSYGYIAVFLGALIEGETIILGASALAYAGYLNIYYVAIVAFIATTFAEQTCYMIGRHYGVSLFDKYPKLKGPSQKAFNLLKKVDVLFILICRFVYGIRTVSPFVVGAANIPPKKFFPLNILAAFIWASASCYAGYQLGEVIMNNFESIKHVIEKIFIWIPVIIILIVLTIYFIKKKLSKKQV